MKYIPVCLICLLLIFSGGVASRVLFPPSIEKTIAKQSDRILKKAGVDSDSDQFDQYFISLAGPAAVATTEPVMLKHLGGKVWGASVGTSENTYIPKNPQSRFSATLSESGIIDLSGVVHSSRFKNGLESAAHKAIGTNKVENNLSVNEELESPLWADSAPEFLKHFLSFSGVTKLAAGIDGVKLEGEVLSREVREKLGIRAAAFVSAPAVVNNNLSVARPQYPTFKIQGSANGFKLSGLLPDDITRKNLIAAINKALPDREVKDEIMIAGGVSKPWWLPNAETLVPMFFKETDGLGSVEYWKNRLQIKGKVGNESFATQLSSVPLGPEKPENFSMESHLSLRPVKDPEFSVFTNEKGKLVAQGTVGSPKVKNQILSGLIKNQPDEVVLDQINVRNDVKDFNWGSPEKLIQEVMYKVEDGALRMAANRIEINGEVESDSHRDQLAGYAAGIVGSSGTVENAISVKEGPVEITAPPVLDEPEFDLKELAIYFRSGSTRLGGSDYTKLKTAASLIKTLAPDTKLIVGGYADNRGSKATNERLSGKRAAAVLNYLVKQGVDKNKLKIKTYGEDVSNVSRRNLWKSRRVELAIQRE